jgi:FHA domain
LTTGNQSLDPRAGLPRLSGRVVVGELIRNMELGQFEMAYAVLLPCVFTVYLNPADYATLSGVLNIVIDDARKALRARVAELNTATTSSFGLKRRTGKPKEHKIACLEWDIEFLPDGEVPPGDVEIHSELNEAPPPGFRGVKTTLIGREPAATQRISERRRTQHSAEPVFAAIQYEDESGRQTYLITQNQVRIGRGGDGQEVDLFLHASDEISREHAVIRRDAATGAFSILDGSTNGTWVNGKRLRKGSQELLPAKAQIILGEVLRLDFEVRL